MTSGDGAVLFFLVKPHERQCTRRNLEDMAEPVADEKGIEGLQIPEAAHNEYRPDDETQQERRKSERALVRKLDCFIAPVMMLLMLISYLDRGNIGFAATQGMSTDIGLKGSQLNVCIPCRCRCGGDPRVNIVLDSSFSLLHLLHPRGISYVYLGQAATVPPSHSHHYLLLGDSMPLHGICTVVRFPCGVPHTVGIFRRLSFPCHDLVPLQLVQARGAGGPYLVPLQ